jgi:HK97 family phage major capsid protein
MGTLSMEQLNEQIKAQAESLMKEHVGSQVASAVAKAMEKALAPSDKIEGLTKSQEAQAEAIKQLQSATQGKSALSTSKRVREKGEALGTIVRCMKAARNDIGGTARLLKKEGQDDLAELMQEQAKSYEGSTDKAMMAGDPDTGGILIPTPVSQEVVDILRARVVVTALGPTFLPIPSGNYRLPKVTQGVQGSYVGESSAAAVEQVKSGSVLLSFKKLVANIPASNDLFRFSSPGADQLIRNQVVNGLAVRKDQAFLRGQGTDATPKGLRYWCKADNLISGAGSNGIALYATVLGTMINKLIAGNCPMMKPAWIISPRTYMSMLMVRSTTGDFILRPELAAGTLFGYPYRVSTQVPENLTDGGGTTETEIYLVDFGDVIVGEAQNLVIDASGQAAYEEGGTVKAAFSRDETVIRAIDEHDMVVLRDACIAVANKVAWVIA